MYNCISFNSFSSNCSLINDNVLKAICDRCPKLRSLDIWRCFNVSDNGLIFTAQNFKNLEYLHIDYSVETANQILDVNDYLVLNMDEMFFTAEKRPSYGKCEICKDGPFYTFETLRDHRDLHEIFPSP